MSCATPSNCQPCANCGQSTPPVLPRCDVVLPDGAYTNATVVVEDGCIIDVQGGTPLLYQPDSCCAAPGSGGGGDGLDGDDGDPGAAATVQVGTVGSIPYGSAPTVTNSGSAANAILNFEIPRGEPGADGVSPTGATSLLGGITLQDGAIKTPLPVAWPPVLAVQFAGSPPAGVSFTAAKNDANGVVTLTLDMTAYANAVAAQISDLTDRLTALETANLDARVTAVEAAIAEDKVRSYTVAGVPSAATEGAGTLIYVSDETGGAVLAFSDGANWLRATDRAVIS